MPWRFPTQYGFGGGERAAQGARIGLGAAQMAQRNRMMQMQMMQMAEARQENWKKWMGTIAASLLKEGYNEAAKGIYDIIGVPVGELTPKPEEKGPEVKWKEKTPVGKVPALKQIPVLGQLFGGVPQEETVGVPIPELPEGARKAAQYKAALIQEGVPAPVAEKWFPKETPKRNIKIISKKVGKGRAQDYLVVDGQLLGSWGDLYNRWKGSDPTGLSRLYVIGLAAGISPEKLGKWGKGQLSPEDANKIIEKIQEIDASILERLLFQGSIPFGDPERMNKMKRMRELRKIKESGAWTDELQAELESLLDELGL